jgi:hypothetical protein
MEFAVIYPDNLILQFIPTEHRTLDLCRIAVERDGASLQHVPHHHKTPNVCLAAKTQWMGVRICAITTQNI